MPIFEVQDPQGRTLQIDGDHEPSMSELQDIFSQAFPAPKGVTGLAAGDPYESIRGVAAQLQSITPEQREQASKPLITLPETTEVQALQLGGKLDIPGAETAGRAVQAIEAPVKRMVEGFTSPMGIATLPAWIGAPELMLSMTALQTGPQAVQSTKEAVQAARAGKPIEALGAASEAALNAAMTVAPLLPAIKMLPRSGREVVRQLSEPIEQPTAEVSDASSQRTATTEDGNLRPSPEPSVREVPAEEGGARIQPQAEGRIPQAEAQAQPAVSPVADVESIPATENGGRIAIVLPNGTAVVGGRIHADTWNRAIESGAATDADLSDGMAGFVKPDGTAWGVNGKPLPNVSKVIIVGSETPKPPELARQRPPAPEIKPAPPSTETVKPPVEGVSKPTAAEWEELMKPDVRRDLREEGVTAQNVDALLSGKKTPEQVVSEQLGIKKSGGGIEASTMIVEENPDGSRSIGFTPEAGPASTPPANVGTMSHEDAIRVVHDNAVERINSILRKIKPPPESTGTAPQTEAPATAAVSEAKPGEVTAPPEPSAISQPTTTIEETQATQSPQISRGPGAAAAGEPGTYSAISQLTDKLNTTPAKTPTDALQTGEKIADAWAKGKSLITGALGKLATVPAALKREYAYVRKFDDVTRQIGLFDRIVQTSAGKSRDAGQAMRESVKNTPMREGMAFQMEGATPEQIRAALANLPKGTKPSVRRAMEAALKLPEDVRNNASDMAQFFAQRGEEAINEGVLEHLLNDYYTHIWRDTRNMPSKLTYALNRGKVNEYFQYALQRKIPTLLEGIAEGKEPLLDPASVIPRYNYLLDQAIASRHLMKSLEDLTVTDTDPATGKTRSRPLLAPVGTRRTIYDKNQVPQARLIKVHIAGEEASDYRAIDHPSLRKWIWAATDDKGVPVFYEGDLRVHPAHYERLARMMDRSRLTAGPIERKLLAASTEVKGFKLGVASFFHPIQVGTHALFHHISPLVHGEIDWDSPAVHFAIEKGGLHVGPSPEAITSYAEGILTRGLVNKVPIIGPWSHALAEWTFADYIPRLKLATFDRFYERTRKRYPNLSEEEAAARAGDATNNAYGEQNMLWLGKEGRDPHTQRMLRLAFLAPDFGESRLRFVLKAFTKYGGEERLGLITAASALWIASRIGNVLSHGDPEIHDAKHLFDVKIGDRWFGVRSIVGDIGHLLNNFRQFWEVRLNPLYSRSLLALLSGRDVSGHSLTKTRFAEDVAKQLVPIHLSGLTRDDRQVWESMMAAMGLQTWRAGATTEIHQLAQEWRKQRGIQGDTEILPGPDSPYRKARLALEFGKRQDFIQAVNQLYQQRKASGDPTPRETIRRNFNRYYHQPFSGNTRLEPLFQRSLSTEQKSVYRNAQKEREKLWLQFQSWF